MNQQVCVVRLGENDLIAELEVTANHNRKKTSIGVGHNLPHEAPQAIAEAVIEVDGY